MKAGGVFSVMARARGWMVTGEDLAWMTGWTHKACSVEVEWFRRVYLGEL